MRILFLNWKDILHPASGGAEILTDALASHLAITNEVFFVTSSFPGAPKKEIHNNYTIIRAGSTKTCILHAYFLYKKLSQEKQFDLIIDQVHGIPFFSTLYPHHQKILVLIHEIAGELWAGILPHSIGNIIDMFWLWLYNKQQFITVSNSTKQELMEHQIPEYNIHIVPNFTNISLPDIPKKAEHPTLLVLGRIAPVKRIEHAIRAFQILKETIPTARLVIIGKREKKYETYYQYIKTLAFNDKNIEIITNADEQEKLHWLKQSHILLMPSKKEGYGIAILEAAACRTPAIGYNVAGVRDAITDDTTGLIAHKERPESLTQCTKKIINDASLYAHLQQNAYEHAKNHNKSHTLQLWDTLSETRT